MNKKILGLFTALMLVMHCAAWATPTSTVNPAVPAYQAPLTSSMFRTQFAAAYNDINALWTYVYNLATATTNAANITSGVLYASRLPAFTGDVTKPSGSAVQTLATVNGNVGLWGTTSAVPFFTVNSKGLVTAAGQQTLLGSALGGNSLPAAIIYSSVTQLGTSAVLPGSPTTTTQTLGDNTTKIATTAFVQANAASQSLTNTHIRVGNVSNIGTDVAVSGDATLANTGALTVTKTGGVAFAPSATTDTTSGTNISSGTVNSARLGTVTAGNIPYASGGQLIGTVIGSGLSFNSHSGLLTASGSATTGTFVLAGNGSGGFQNLTNGNGITTTGGTLAATQPADRTIASTSGLFYSSDAGKFIIHSNASANSMTLQSAAVTGWTQGYSFIDSVPCTSGADTITTTTSLINGGATLVVPPCSDAFVRSNGTDYTASFWYNTTTPPISVTPAGSDKQVQLKDHGILYASAGLTFNSASGALAVGGPIKLSDGRQNCSHTSDKGFIRFNSSSLNFQRCNGTAWADVGNGNNLGTPSAIVLTNATGLPVAGGGTGMASGTSGGVPYFNTTSTMASSAVLTTNTLIKGGGAGAAPFATGIMVDSNNAVSGALDAINSQSGTSYDVTATDCGTTILLTSGSSIAVTAAAAPLAGCSVEIIQGGAGQASFTADSGATINNAHSQTKTFGQYATVRLKVRSNTGGAAVWNLAGDTGS